MHVAGSPDPACYKKYNMDGPEASISWAAPERMAVTVHYRTSHLYLFASGHQPETNRMFTETTGSAQKEQDFCGAETDSQSCSDRR